MSKLGGHNTKLEGKDTDEKSLEDKEKAEMAHADDKDKKDMKASYKKEESELDIKADVDALIGDSDLSEEFKQKAATIFETAIKAKVKEESQRLQGEYETKLKEDTEAHKADVVEKVDSVTLTMLLRNGCKKTRSLLREVSKAKLLRTLLVV